MTYEECRKILANNELVKAKCDEMSKAIDNYRNEEYVEFSEKDEIVVRELGLIEYLRDKNPKKWEGKSDEEVMV